MPSPISDTQGNMRHHFDDQLSVQLEAIHKHFHTLDHAVWQPDEIATLHRLLKNISNSADTLGMRSVSIASRNLEIRLATLIKSGDKLNESEWTAIAAAIQQLDQLARSRITISSLNLQYAPIRQSTDQSPRIYLLADEPIEAGQLRQAMLDAGYQVEVFSDPAELQACCTNPKTNHPAALVLDLALSEGDTAGIELLAEIQACEPAPPAMIFVSADDDLPTRLTALRAGASHFLLKPVNTYQLIAQLDTLTGLQAISPYRVLMLDDDPLLLDAHAEILRSAGMTVKTLSQPLQFLHAVDEFKPDVIVLDVYMHDANGIELATVLRERETQFYLPILFLSAETNISQQLLALNLGGNNFLIKPVQDEHLVAAVSVRAQQVQQNNRLQQHLAASLYEREREHLALNQHAIVSFADESGKISYVNDRFCEVSGYSREELLGQNHSLVKSGLHPAEFYQNLWRTIAQGEIWQGDICNRGKDGNLYWVASTITPFVDEQGKPYQYVSIRTDITHVKQAEAELMENQARLNFLVSASPVCIYTSKATTPYSTTYISPNVKQLMGYEPSLFTADPHFWTGNIHPDDCQQVFDNLAQLFEHDSLWQEYRYRMPDGSYRWMHDEMRLVRNEAGEPDEIIGYWADLTERKHAEIALKQSEEHHRLILTCTDMATWDWDITSSQVHFNERWAEMRGYSLTEIDPHIESWKKGIHPDDMPLLSSLLEAHFARETDLLEAEYRVKTQSGEWIWILDRGAVISRDSDGTPLRMAGTEIDITARKHAEAEAEALKERLRRGQIYANIGTWEWKIQSGDLYWSERIAPLFGYPAGNLETTYDNFLAAVHPDDRQAVTDAVGACIEDDTPYEIEHRVVWPDGTVRWLLERGAVVRDANGKAIEMLGVVQDIDDRKRADLALIERERQLREAQNLARIGNWVADLTNGKLHWSDEIYRIFGHEPGSFTPSVEAFHAAVHPDDLAKVHESEKQAGQNGRHDIIHRIVLPDGSVRHVHELALAETDTEGNLLRLTGTVQDITERVEAELRLHETEERFAFAVEGAGDGIWDWDMRSNTMQFSRIYMEMLGYAENELPHTVDSWINSIHTDDLEAFKQTLHDFLEGLIPVFAVELRLRCKDDSYRWILCRGTVGKRDSNGRPIRMIGIHSDITDRKQAEQALIIARDEADQASRAKSEFLSNMSHELRTPMNAILGFGQIMELDTGLSCEQKENIQEILKGGHHLLELINEVLDLAKVESGSIDLSLEPVELCQIIDGCITLTQSMAEKHNVQLSHSCMGGTAVRADQTRLKQILLNLLSNAIKYNRDGGSVKLDVRPVGTDRLRILVTDTGIGIASDRLVELFEPFNRLDAENSGIEGTGIGLTITRRIVEMMGGSVDVTSEIDVGSTFWIELPLEFLAADDHPQASTSSGTTLLQQDIDEPQHIVLYIEDNPSNLKLMTQILGRRQHIHLLTAHTPQLGIALARSHHPELILLDINMPGMDGYEVLKVLKDDARMKDIPVVAVTANAMPQDIENGLASGFTDYLTKPLDILRLNDVMDTCLKNQVKK